MSGTGGRNRSSCSRPGHTAEEVAVGVVAMRPRPVVVRKRRTLDQDDVAGVTRKVPLPLDNVGRAIDEHVRGGVEVVVQTLGVGIEE